MTSIRRGAIRVARFVVRNASAGSREWADGLAREVEEIPGDWHALAWALGALRVLLDRREAPIRSLDEARSEALRTVERQGNGLAVVNVLLFGQGLQFAARELLQPHARHRTGLLVFAATAVMMSVVLFFVRKPLIFPETDGGWEWAVYFRAELARQSSLRVCTSIWVSMVLFVIGSVEQLRGGLPANRGFALAGAAFAFFGLLLMAWRRRQDRLRIGQLDALWDGEVTGS